MSGDGFITRALREGNIAIFREMGTLFARFLHHLSVGADPSDAFPDRTGGLPGRLTDQLSTADDVLLRDGARFYARALEEPDEQRRVELILAGNVLFSAFEQKRADPLIDQGIHAAVRLPLARLLRWTRGDDAGERFLRRPHASQRKPVMTLERWLARLATRFVLVVETPTGLVRLGKPVASPAGVSVTPDTIDDPEARAVLGRYGPELGAASRDWTSYADRMNFITGYFLAYGQVPALRTRP